MEVSRTRIEKDMVDARERMKFAEQQQDRLAQWFYNGKLATLRQMLAGCYSE
jgi:hypothetical protein